MDFQSTPRIDPFSFNHREPKLFYTSKILSAKCYRCCCIVWMVWHIVWLALEPLFLYSQNLLPDKEWPVQVTHICYVVLTIYSVTDLLSAFQDKKGCLRMTFLLKFTWFLYVLTIGSAPIITVLYFSVHTRNTQLNSINFHVLNTVYAIWTFVIGNKPLRIAHVIYPMLFAAVYVLINSTYQSAMGTVLYSVFDWRKICDSSFKSLVLVFFVIPLLYLLVCFLGKYKERLLTWLSSCTLCQERNRTQNTDSETYIFVQSTMSSTETCVMV